MPSLRDFRDRIKSVKSTKKITSAMKMVAAAKLRRAQEQAEAAQPYARSMAQVMERVAQNLSIDEQHSPLLTGTGSDQRHLLIVVTADRGLCGGFNANIIKAARKFAYELRNEGKDVEIICVGRKGYDALQTDMKTLIKHSFLGLKSKKKIEYKDAQDIRDYIVSEFEAGSFDVCTLVYNKFRSVMSQVPSRQQLIPFNLEDLKKDATAQSQAMPVREEGKPGSPLGAAYEFEPSEEEILEALLPRNIGVQIYRAVLDSSAGEQAARMTAMDNATRNAGEMIDDLSLQYNRARQAYITKELIEIISGAEAL